MLWNLEVKISNIYGTKEPGEGKKSVPVETFEILIPGAFQELINGMS